MIKNKIEWLRKRIKGMEIFFIIKILGTESTFKFPKKINLWILFTSKIEPHVSS